jgi:hypothetical protein
MRPSTADECDSAVTAEDWMGEVESAHRLSGFFICEVCALPLWPGDLSPLGCEATLSSGIAVLQAYK